MHRPDQRPGQNKLKNQHVHLTNNQAAPTPPRRRTGSGSYSGRPGTEHPFNKQRLPTCNCHEGQFWKTTLSILSNPPVWECYPPLARPRPRPESDPGTSRSTREPRGALGGCVAIGRHALPDVAVPRAGQLCLPARHLRPARPAAAGAPEPEVPPRTPPRTSPLVAAGKTKQPDEARMLQLRPSSRRAPSRMREAGNQASARPRGATPIAPTVPRML